MSRPVTKKMQDRLSAACATLAITDDDWNDIICAKRINDTPKKRAAIAWLMYEGGAGGVSLPDVAVMLNNPHHSTIMTALSKIAKWPGGDSGVVSDARAIFKAHLSPTRTGPVQTIGCVELYESLRRAKLNGVPSCGAGEATQG